MRCGHLSVPRSTKYGFGLRWIRKPENLWAMLQDFVMKVEFRPFGIHFQLAIARASVVGNDCRHTNEDSISALSVRL